MSNNFKDLYGFMADNDLLEFGSVITGEMVLAALNISYPETGTKQEFNDLDLYVLSAVEYVRKVIVEDGKYLAQSGGNYRILLPSENAQQCAKYIKSAQKKLNKSLRLSKNTPVGDYAPLHDMTARAHIKLASIRNNEPGQS